MESFYKTFLLLFISISLTFNSFSQQAPGIEWAKCYGGSYSEEANSIQQTSDKGYIVAGWTDSNDSNVSGNHGYVDYWIIKLDSLGSLQWQTCLGGTDDEHANFIEQTFDGGYIVAGYAVSNDGNVTGNHGSADCWIVKLDANGSLDWQKCLGGSGYEATTSIQQTKDSGFVVSAWTCSNDGDVSGNHSNDTADYWIVKLDNTGNIQWQKCLGGTNNDWAYSVEQTSDSGFIVAGTTYSNDGNVTGNNGGYDEWIVKLYSNGSVAWQKCLGGSSREDAYSIQQTYDGGYVVAGFSSSDDGDVSGVHIQVWAGDFWIVKLDNSGNLQWQRALGGSSTDIAYSIRQTMDGGYIIGGYNHSNDGDVTGFHGSGDMWIVKIDNNGNLQWQKALGGSMWEQGYSIQQTSDVGYIVAGYAQSPDGDVIGNQGLSEDYWIIKLLPDTITSINQLPHLPNYPITISPNPSNGIFQITFPDFSKVQNFGKVSLEVINTLGQTVFTSDLRLPTSDFQTHIDVSFLPKGIYVLKINDGAAAVSSKFVIE